eukprot:CAMPEP_0171829852 /NCGR_PEP_ID=MMETSP0992-20121227/7920_1 /TAXON_ID=483369 /ORGANISM="non described non described, Strain CCMP2098" /LENGTH=1132 /DNA_ID=CAMNT_0012445135 /DNA_START=42 /DNA_END=3440 /DNA_ORIENTATION=-
MKGQVFIVALLGNVVVALAYGPAGHFRGWTAKQASPRLTNRRASSGELTMLVEASGSDCFSAIQKKASKGSSFLRSLPAPLTSAVLTGLVPLSGVVGALIPVPVPLKIATLYGASLLGAQGRRKIVPELDSAAMLELAQLLETDYAKVTPASVMEVQRKFKLPDDVFADIRIDVFSQFVTAILASPEFKTSELRELSALYSTLNLDPEQLGDALFASFEACWAKNVQWTNTKILEDPESLERMTLDKCLFLLTRSLSDLGDSSEGVAYVVARCAQVLHCETTEITERCLQIGLPLYEKAIKTAVTKLDKVTPQNVAKARTSLGLTLEDVDEINIKVYRSEVVGWFEAHQDSFKEDGVERMAKLASVLALDEATAKALELEEMYPVFEYEVSEMVREVVSDHASITGLAGKIATAQLKLTLSSVHVQMALLQAAINSLTTPYQEAVEYLGLGNPKAALRSLVELRFAKDVSKTILETMTDTRLVGEEVLAQFFEDALPKERSSVTDELYQLLLQDTLTGNEKGVTEELLDSTVELGAMMAVGEQASAQAMLKVAGPLLEAKIEGYLAGGMDSLMNPELRVELSEFAEGLAVPPEVYGRVALAQYAKQLKANPPNVKEQGSLGLRQELLDATRFFLQLGDNEWDKAVAMHLESGASLFESSVKEALGMSAAGAAAEAGGSGAKKELGSGVITEQFKEGLEKLGALLMLTPEAQNDLILVALKGALKPRVDRLVNSFEQKVLSKEEYARRRGVDTGEDLNVDPGSNANLGIEENSLNFMDEVLNLVDFFEGNSLWAAPEGSEAAADGFTYALTASGMFENNLIIEDLYRQFSISSLQEAAAKQQSAGGGAGAAMGMMGGGGDGADDSKAGARMAKAKSHFAGMLGMSNQKKKSVDKDMGKSVYGNYVNDLLKRKGGVDPQDLQQLAQIQNTMGMEDSYALELLSSMKKTHVFNVVERAFIENTEIDGEAVQQVKVAADKAGVDLVDDLTTEITAPRRMKLFMAESVAAIATGLCTDENKELIGEFQEGWGVPADKAEEAFVKMVGSTCDECGAEATVGVQQGTVTRTVKALDKLAAFSQFVPEEFEGVKVGSEGMKAKLLDMYSKAKDSGEAAGGEDQGAALEKAMAALDAVLTA